MGTDQIVRIGSRLDIVGNGGGAGRLPVRILRLLDFLRRFPGLHVVLCRLGLHFFDFLLLSVVGRRRTGGSGGGRRVRLRGLLLLLGLRSVAAAPRPASAIVRRLYGPSRTSGRRRAATAAVLRSGNVSSLQAMLSAVWWIANQQWLLLHGAPRLVPCVCRT